ncbi:hypothetical protein RUM44_004847 [Polyplax serrata]|uniref:Uncharacterized protein n=1 Tax=Polyplax serrata TaxID=468196 RepID=A0ABR1B3Y6_POLSC
MKEKHSSSVIRLVESQQQVSPSGEESGDEVNQSEEDHRAAREDSQVLAGVELRNSTKTCIEFIIAYLYLMRTMFDFIEDKIE